MKRIIHIQSLAVLFVSWASVGTAQWSTTVGGWEYDTAHDVVQVSDGGLIVAGETRSFGTSGSWLLKLDDSGGVQWEYSFDGAGSIRDMALAPDGSNVVAVAGSWVMMFDPSLGVVWQKEITAPDDFSLDCVAVDASGNTVLAGIIKTEPNGDLWVVKVDSGGDILWQERLGGDNIEFLADVIATADGGTLVAGVSFSFGPNNGDLWLIKLDAGGAATWQRTYGLYFGGNENSEKNGYVIENAGGYLLAAHTAPLPSGNHDLWMLQLDPSGVIQWQKMYETLGDFVVADMVPSGDGGALLAGYKGGGTTAFGWSMKLDTTGVVQWLKNYAAPTPFAYDNYDPLYGITRLADGRLALVGGSESLAIDDGFERKDAWIFLTDSSGDVPGCASVGDGLVPVATETTEPDVTTSVTAVATSAAVTDGTAVPVATEAFTGDGCKGTVRNFLDLPKTGLTTTYHAGDDGEVQAGVAWPAERFADNGDGTVSDRLTGLMWLKDANCAATIGHDPDGEGPGEMIWDSALDFVAGINDGTLDIADCGTYTGDFDDWRLANVIEQISLINAGATDRTAWLNSQGFENVQSAAYWTSTFDAGTSNYRWNVTFNSEIQTRAKGSSYHAWPVRAGQLDGNPDPSYAANMRRTGQSYPGDDEIQPGVRSPGHRFVNNGDGTLTDSLTGLTWLQDVGCLGVRYWTDALDTVADFNANPGPYACHDYGADPKSDWRMANHVELGSLVDYSEVNPALSDDHQFVNFPKGGRIWSSNTETSSHLTAWGFHSYKGVMIMISKNVYPSFTMLVRGELPSTTGTGVFRPSNGLIYLKSTNETGFADARLFFGLPGDLPVTGDWDGDGVDTIGIYRNGVFYLRNANTTGYADLTFAFGAAGDLPVAGDWNGDGVDTVGIYRNGQFMLRNSNSSGALDIIFALGIIGDEPIAGDWDDDGTDSAGVFRPTNGLIYLKNENSTGFADIEIVFGIPGDKPTVGDWDGDGTDTIGVYRHGLFLLRNSNTTGYADVQFALGVSGDLPISGKWGTLP